MFYGIIALGGLGAALGLIALFLPLPILLNIALISLGAGLLLLGVAVKKVVDGLKALMAPPKE